MANNKYTQSNVNGDNVMNFGQLRFEMTEPIMHEILSKLDKALPTVVAWKGGGRGEKMAKMLKKFLDDHGVNSDGTVQVGLITNLNPEHPISIYPNGFPGGMFGDAQTVYIDPSI